MLSTFVLTLMKKRTASHMFLGGSCAEFAQNIHIDMKWLEFSGELAKFLFKAVVAIYILPLRPPATSKFLFP